MEKLKAKLDSLKSSKQEMEETMQSEIAKLQKDIKLKEEEIHKIKIIHQTEKEELEQVSEEKIKVGIK